MPSFNKRSYQKELLDGDTIPFAAIWQNMVELDTINHLLGGHQITLRGVKSIPDRKPKQPWHIVEIGCGGGDNLRVIQKWAAQQQIQLKLTGIDINNECVAFARSKPEHRDIQFIVSDYKAVSFIEAPDIIFSSLFSHHFTDEELITQLKWMYNSSRKGFFINDLHRHPLAYYSIKSLTSLFSKSYLVKNDAPLSVLRGFKKAEWKGLCRKAGLSFVSYRWCWAFRWLIVCKK